MKNQRGKAAKVEFRCEADYAAFKLADRHPAVRFACATAQALGLAPRTVSMNGGLDANPLNAMGIPTVTFGAGQHGAHSVEEYVDLNEYLAGCGLAVALASRT